MVTTRRSENVNTYDNGATGGVGLLERPRSFSAPASSVAEEVETQSDARQRMQKNLDKLLNYDRYAQMQEEQVVDVETAPLKDSLADEDIRPTSTTMQFGDDIDKIREEMRAREQEEESSYTINSKGKLAIILYSLAVTIILALIVLNTGVLASLSNTSQQKTAELNSVIEKYNAVDAKIDSISSSDYIIDIAQNQYGMIKK